MPRLRRTATSLLAALGAALVLTIAPPGPVGAATATDGLLAAQVQFINDSGVETYMPSALWGAREFSPDGTKLAGSTQTSTLKVWDNDGTEIELATLPGPIEYITWSPDQTQVAVLVEVDLIRFAIYRVPVAAHSTPVLVIGDSATFTVASSYDNQISWSPTGNKIAFVGTESMPDGTSLSVHAFQLYTVPAFGGARARFNAHQAEGCQLVCTYYDYVNPTWSPDAGSITALVEKHTEICTDDGDCTSTYEQYVGIATQGAPGAASLRSLSKYVNPLSWSHLGGGPLIWSADGTKLLLGIRPAQHESAVATVVNGTTGATIRTFGGWSGVYTDWQPCPTGTCASWVIAPRTRTTLKGRIPGTSWRSATPPSVIGELTIIGPTGNATGPIRLVIDAKVARSAKLTAAMKNRFSFKIPVLKKGAHTLRLEYGGSSKYLLSSTGTVKVTVK